MTVVKICGLRRFDDVMAAAAAGADVLGFNFWPGTQRCVAVRDAAGMIAAMRAENGPLPLACGLFVNADAAAIAATVARCGLDLVQLAGDETPEDVARLTVPAIKTLRPLPDEDAVAFHSRVAAWKAAACDLPAGPFGTPLIILLDANVPGHYGGTGQTGDWSFAAVVGGAGSLTPSPPSREEGGIQSRLSWPPPDAVASATFSEGHGVPTASPLPRGKGDRGLGFFLAGGLTPENVGAAVRAVRPWGVDTASGVEVPGQPGVKDAARLRAFVAAVRAAEVADVRG